MKRICSLFLVAALGVGCTATLGSRAADQARAEDIGTTVGGVASVVPIAPAIAAALAPLADLAGREAERRAATEGEGGLSLWTQILFGIAAAGTAVLGLRSRRQTAHIDELYDETKALAVKAAATPKA